MLDYYHFKDIDDLFAKGMRDEARHLLMEMQAKYIAVCEENATLHMQLHEFEDILYLSRNLVFDGTCFWLITGGIKQGPFCQTCYNRDGALVRLDYESDEWKCVSCGTVHDREYAVQGQTILASAPKTAKVIPLFG